MFFSTCALFDIRKREHALGFVGFAMEVIGIFCLEFLVCFSAIRVSFEGGPVLEKGGT